jgi:hypothetical protein
MFSLPIAKVAVDLLREGTTPLSAASVAAFSRAESDAGVTRFWSSRKFQTPTIARSYAYLVFPYLSVGAVVVGAGLGPTPSRGALGPARRRSFNIAARLPHINISNCASDLILGRLTSPIEDDSEAQTSMSRIFVVAECPLAGVAPRKQIQQYKQLLAGKRVFSP